MPSRLDRGTLLITGATSDLGRAGASRPLRMAYILGDILGLSAPEGARCSR